MGVLNLFSLSEFSWVDLVDVLIVGFVFYRILLLIRGTRAVRMGVGLILLFVAGIVARLIGLSTVDWILSNVFAYIVFAVIVLFQSELRSVLATLGRTPFFRSLTHPVALKPYEDIVSAATSMAAERRGAIIVLEREVGLRDFVQAGINLDAVISFDLLVSIFHTDSPMHDGAVIIQGDRVAAASCFLPLTHNPRQSRKLGSRHRAALGISEETDAVVIVVSEETGSISLAIDGRITRRMDAASLLTMLENLMEPELEEDDGDASGERGFVGEDVARGDGR